MPLKNLMLRFLIEKVESNLEIISWTKPGRFLVSSDKAADWRVGVQIQGLERALVEANVALNMFLSVPERYLTREQFFAKRDVRNEITRDVQLEFFPDGMTPQEIPLEEARQEFRTRRTKLDRMVMQRMWKAGYPPESHLNCHTIIFAKAFVHAMDLFEKFLFDISKDVISPKEIIEIREGFRRLFPDLRGVRDSIQHGEDRSKGMQKGKPIDIKSVDKKDISATGKILFNIVLNDTKIGSTMANGEYGEVEVSLESVELMLATLKRVYSVFDWCGGEELFPI